MRTKWVKESMQAFEGDLEEDEEREAFELGKRRKIRESQRHSQFADGKKNVCSGLYLPLHY